MRLPHLFCLASALIFGCGEPSAPHLAAYQRPLIAADDPSVRAVVENLLRGKAQNLAEVTICRCEGNTFWVRGKSFSARVLIAGPADSVLMHFQEIQNALEYDAELISHHGDVGVYASREAWQRKEQLLEANDRQQLIAFHADRQGVDVPQGTRCKVLSTDEELAQVMILEGELTGQEWTVHSSNLFRLQAE